MARILKPLVRGGGWYPSKKWIPLVKNGGYTTQNGGDNVNWAKVSGVSPLSLPNALAHFINSLRQIGKCTVSGTDITCNNGVLKYDPELGIYADGTPEEIRVTGVNQWDEEWVVQGTHINSKNNIPVRPNTEYAWVSPAQPANGFRFLDADGNVISAVYSINTGKFTTPANCYYVWFGMASSYGTTYNHDISINYPSTDHDYHPSHIETATASNLFAVGSVTDEQDIISGKITRRCEAVVSDGTTPSGRYIGTVGEGNILVCAKETGYSGAIASFTADKAEPLSGLVAQINPVQDLHGQSNPYPAGGGVNIFPNSPAETKTYNGITIVSDGMGKYTISGTATAYGEIIFDLINEFTIPSSISSGGSGCLYLNNSFVADSNEFMPAFMYNDTQADSWTLSSINRVSSTYSAMGGKQCNKIKFAFYAGASISGTIAPMISNDGSTNYDFSPYSNECPITGWQGLQGQRTGANLFDKSTGIQLEPNNLRIARTQGYGVPFKLRGGVTYTFSCNSSEPHYSYLLVPYSTTVIAQSNAKVTSFTYTPSEDVEVGINFWWNTGRPSDATDFMIEVGSVAHDYAEYQGEAISASFGRTVYGGTDEVVSGNGISTMGIVDLGTLTDSGDTGWKYITNDGNPYFRVYLPGRKPGLGFICSDYETSSTTGTGSLADKRIGASSNDIRIYLRDSSYTSLETFLTAMSGVQLCYELAEPTTFTHTGQSVDTLVGQNNVFVDTGNVTAYIPDFTTEQVAGQSLSTTEGTNTVFVTSNVDPVEIEVEYAVAPEE